MKTWIALSLSHLVVFFFFTITTFCLGNPYSKGSESALRQKQLTRCPPPPQESDCLCGRSLPHCPSNSMWNSWAHVVATCESALHAHTLGVNLLFSSLFASLLSFTLWGTKGFKHNTAFQKSEPSWPGIWKINTSSIHWLYRHGKQTNSQKWQICHWLP